MSSREKGSTPQVFDIIQMVQNTPQGPATEFAQLFLRPAAVRPCRGLHWSAVLVIVKAIHEEKVNKLLAPFTHDVQYVLPGIGARSSSVIEVGPAIEASSFMLSSKSERLISSAKRLCYLQHTIQQAEHPGKSEEVSYIVSISLHCVVKRAESLDCRIFQERVMPCTAKKRVSRP